ncbi:MAG: family 10 glycosylhydrolase [Candidatus Cloacimonetes bacterium]|nr:family 10 glycosylhydrolase [Candidatus Cloacimonadota bacterium]
MIIKKIYIILILILCQNIRAEEMRALWIPAWDLGSREQISRILTKAADADFNTVLVEVRFRSDTFYTPNRDNCDFPNPDSTSQLLQEDFDALQYIIDLCYVFDLQVYAWLTMYVATSNDLAKCSLNNPWYRTPHWITRNVNFEKMEAREKEGAYLDPGLPEVQNYLYNVVLDVAVNYDIAGIQLDYIRYPGNLWGYHEESFARYQQEVRKPSPANWQKWRCDQVTDLVKKIRRGLKSHAPEVELTAAVVSDPEKAVEDYNQDWLLWLRKGYVTRVFPMNYHAADPLYQKAVDKIAKYGYEPQTVMGIRAWSDSGGYTVEDINEKISYSWRKGIFSYALFSSTGLENGGYWKNLNIRKSR